MLEVACPSCSARLSLPPNAAGKKARCPKCGAVFPVDAPASQPPAAPAPNTAPPSVSKPPEAIAPTPTAIPISPPKPAVTVTPVAVAVPMPAAPVALAQPVQPPAASDKHHLNFDDGEDEIRPRAVADWAEARIAGRTLWLRVAGVAYFVWALPLLGRTLLLAAANRERPSGYTTGYVFGSLMPVALAIFLCLCLFGSAANVRAGRSRGTIGTILAIIFGGLLLFVCCLGLVANELRTDPPGMPPEPLATQIVWWSLVGTTSLVGLVSLVIGIKTAADR